MAWKEIASFGVLALTIVTALPTAAASSDHLSDLKSLVSGFEDPHMDANDLAFYLVTHGFNATPKDGCIEIDLDGHIYKLIPNSSAPGLCNIIA